MQVPCRTCDQCDNQPAVLVGLTPTAAGPDVLHVSGPDWARRYACKVTCYKAIVMPSQDENGWNGSWPVWGLRQHRLCSQNENGREMWSMKTPRSDKDGRSEDEVTATSRPHKYTSRKEKETDEAASAGGEDKNPQRGTAAMSQSTCASNGAPIHIAVRAALNPFNQINLARPCPPRSGANRKPSTLSGAQTKPYPE